MKHFAKFLFYVVALSIILVLLLEKLKKFPLVFEVVLAVVLAWFVIAPLAYWLARDK